MTLHHGTGFRFDAMDEPDFPKPDPDIALLIDRAPRKNIVMSVRLMFRGGDVLHGDSLNISKTGTLVLTEEARPVGTLLRFRFPSFQGIGQVVWTRDSEPGVQFLKLMGIEFLPLEPHDRKVLDELLDASV